MDSAIDPRISREAQRERQGRLIAARDVADSANKALFDWQRAVCSGYGPSPSARLVLLTMSIYVNAKTMECFPSIDLIAIRAGLSRRTVIDRLAECQKAGWFRRWKRQGKGSTKAWAHWHYRLMFPPHILHAGADSALPSEEKALAGANNRTLVVQPLHPNTV